MTVRRVVTLVCDKPGCRESFVGGEGQTTVQVRGEAKKLAGWSVVRAPEHRAGVRVAVDTLDYCRFHGAKS